MPFTDIPPELRDLPAWVIYTRRPRSPEKHTHFGQLKTDKIPKAPTHPYHNLRKEGLAQSVAPFEQAVKAFNNGSGADGIGLVLSETAWLRPGLVGIDLDEVLDPRTGIVPPERQDRLDLMRTLDTYTEVSPSGEGYRLFLEVEDPENLPNFAHDGVEVYTASNVYRFLTVTGNHVPGTPTALRRTTAKEVLALFAPFTKALTPAEADHDLPDTPPTDTLPVPDLDALQLAPHWLTFLKDCNAVPAGYGSDRSAALHGLTTALLRMDLAPGVVFTLLTESDAYTVALEHRRHDHDKALQYIWSGIRKASGFVKGQEASVLDDFPTLDDTEAPEATAQASDDPITSPADWGDYTPPPQKWLWDHWLPYGETTILYADGGTGKTVLAQSLASHAAMDMDFLDTPTERDSRPILLILCEDDKADVVRRQDRICREMGISREDLGRRLLIWPRKGQDSVLMHFPRSDSMGERTAFWKELAKKCLRLLPSLVIIDTAADTFGGNENIRAEVRQFIQRGLTAIATKIDAAVLLLAHPSRAGAEDGTGGSTAWNNTARSRWFLHPDPEREGLLVLRHPKSNRGERQQDKLLHMVTGVPVLLTAQADAGEDGDTPTFETKNQREARETLLLILRALDARGQRVTNAPNSKMYLPLVAAREQRIMVGPTSRIKVSDFEHAMSVLLLRGVLILAKTRGDRKSEDVHLAPVGGEKADTSPLQVVDFTEGEDLPVKPEKPTAVA